MIIEAKHDQTYVSKYFFRSGGFVEPKEHEHWSARYKRSAKILIPWNHAPKYALNL